MMFLSFLFHAYALKIYSSQTLFFAHIFCFCEKSCYVSRRYSDSCKSIACVNGLLLRRLGKIQAIHGKMTL